MKDQRKKLVASLILLLATVAGACAEREMTCHGDTSGCYCKGGGSGSPQRCTEASQAAASSAAYCCATSDFPDGDGVCSCTPIQCRVLGDACECRPGRGSGTPVASCTPKAASKCCLSDVSCGCSERDSCPGAAAEVASCEPSQLMRCKNGSSRVAGCFFGGNDPSATKPSDPRTQPPSNVMWTIGTWYAPAYDDDGTNKHIPPKGLGINADGTYSHNSNGIVDDQGKWKVTGDTITLGSHGSLVRSRNCTFVNYDDGNRTDTYYRDDFPSSCPESVPPLTPVEKCLVGSFSETTTQNLATTNFKWKRTPHRTQIFEQIYSGHTSGDAAITTIYYWSVVDGKLCTEGVDRKSGCSPIDWEAIGKTRVSPKETGCVEP